MMPSIHRSKPIKLWSVNVIKYNGKIKLKFKIIQTNYVCGVGQAIRLKHFITKSITKKLSKDEK